MDLRLTVSPDKSEAYIELLNKIELSKKDIMHYLSERKILFGILEENLTKFLYDQAVGSQILIARGKPVEEGSDGELHYLYNSLNSVDTDENNRVDHRSYSNKITVLKNEKLAECVRAVYGKSGRNIEGDEIVPKEVFEVKLPFGRNVIADPNDENICIAACSGLIDKTADGSLEISPLFIVEGDLDYSVGNIDFDGDVYISGDVLPEFKVVATGNIDIHGVIKDAIVESKTGDITCRSGFVGRHKGQLSAMGDIDIVHIEGQDLFAKGSIIVKNEIIDSNLISGVSVMVEKGRIIGGEICAYRDIICTQAGNLTGTITKLKAGVNKAQEEENHILEVEQQKLNQKLKKFENEKMRIEVFLQRNQYLEPEMSIKYRKLCDVIEQFVNDIGTIEERINTIQNEIINCDSKIIIKGKVFPNVVITIQTEYYKVTDANSNVIFQLGENGIECVPYLNG